MVEFLHNLSFIYYWFDLLFPLKLILAHDFHRIQSSSIFLSDENHSAKRSSPNNFNLLEVVSAYVLVQLWILSKIELCKMCPKELAILEDTNWPVVLGKPKV